ncbi:MAG: hypothetical protein R3324_11045, partial [Halobacteriales archaeon]|nr:hypothetical protein [Halobacteriales archaeon]
SRRPDGSVSENVPGTYGLRRVPSSRGESDRYPALELADDRVVIYDRETVDAWIVADHAVPLPDPSGANDD